MELRQYAMVVWKRWWLILLTTVLAAAAAAGVSFTATPVYRSVTTLEVDPGSDPSQDAYLVARSSEAIAGAYALQATAPAVLEEVAARLQLNMSANKLKRDHVSASQVGQTGMIEIRAEHTNPALAKALAETTAEVFMAHKAAQQQARYGASLQELETQVDELEGEIMRTRAAIAGLGDAEDLGPTGRAELARLETQLVNNQTRLTVLLNSTEQFRLAMARYGNHVTIFSQAELPSSPISPQPLRNTALAAVVGGMIGIGTAFLLDYLDDTVHTPEDARGALGVNVLGALPELAGEDEAVGWLAQAKPLSPTAEAFRSLRTSLQYASLDEPLGSILISSTEPGEGKTFVASNLATVFALMGRKVLLLEADLRRPSLHGLWDEERTPGLTETLKALSQSHGGSQDAEVHAAMGHLRRTRVDGLYMLTSGASISTSAELLNSQTFQRLLAILDTHFDLIVLDAPPVLTVADAAVLANHVDGVVLVTVSGETRLPSAARAIDRIESVGGRLLGLVVNRLSARSGGYYYHYYQYSYEYGYGDRGNGSRKSGVGSNSHRSAKMSKVRDD